MTGHLSTINNILGNQQVSLLVVVSWTAQETETQRMMKRWDDWSNL